MAAGREVAGVLRVGFSSPLVADAVMTAAAAFRDRHTGSDVQIRELHLSDAFGPLRAGELDVQITELPVREPDLTTGPVLVSDPRLLAVSARHPFARSATVTAEDLSRDTILVPSGAPAYLLDTLVPPRTPSGRPVHREPVLTSRQELLTLVSAGEGMAVVGAQAERYHARPDIAYVPIAGLPPIEYAPIWPAGRETAALRTFLRTLRGKPAGQDVAVLRPPAALAWRCPGSCR